MTQYSEDVPSFLHIRVDCHRHPILVTTPTELSWYSCLLVDVFFCMTCIAHREQLKGFIREDKPILMRTVSSLSMSSFSSSDHDNINEELMVIEDKYSDPPKVIANTKRVNYGCSTAWCVSCSLDGLFGKMSHPQCQVRSEENEFDR